MELPKCATMPVLQTLFFKRGLFGLSDSLLIYCMRMIKQKQKIKIEIYKSYVK
jgi:hypothetical protein